MNFKEAYSKLKESSEFKNWQKKNPKTFLAHFFNQLDMNYMQGDWEVGFYDKAKDKITTFVVGVAAVVVKPEDEVFKKEEHHVLELKIDKIKIDLDKAIKTFKQCQEEKYSGQWPMKIFVILQKLDEVTVWNITSATKTFSALNIKINAVDGKIISDKCESFFDLRVKD
ncbi:PepSY domain-containing protein [Candidatus Woesearchaeota archaeon]|nr:PepSY domain-containing protein [Candidatus Woesearchaeota archaeon]